MELESLARFSERNRLFAIKEGGTLGAGVPVLESEWNIFIFPLLRLRRAKLDGCLFEFPRVELGDFLHLRFVEGLLLGGKFREGFGGLDFSDGLGNLELLALDWHGFLQE